MTYSAPKVSILMPSLDVAAYIDECMESVLSQTLEDIEIICIDAGSTDGTLERLRHYAEADSRVTLLVSDVRSYGHQMNMGLDAAHGDYIGIVETDDWAEPHMFERLWETATAHDADFVKSNYFDYWSTPEPTSTPVANLKNCPCGVVICPQEERWVFGVASSIWSGLYRREMLLEEGIRFNETPGASFQDTSFHFMVCSVARRAYLLEEPLLHYRRDRESSSVNSSGKAFCVCDEMRYFEEFLSACPQLAKDLAPFYITVKFNKYRWNYNRLSPELQWAFLDRVYEEFSKHERDGLVEESCFITARYRELRQVLDDRVSYFARTCKAYAARPQGDALPPARELTIIPAGDSDGAFAASVVVHVDDGAGAVERVRALLGRVGDRTEVVCACDGTGEEAAVALAGLAEGDPRLRVLLQVREGVSAAWNHGASCARGAYVLFLAQGDELQRGAVESLGRIMDANGADVLFVTPDSTKEEPVLEALASADGHAGCLALLGSEEGLAMGECAVLMRREFLVGKALAFPEGCGLARASLVLDALAAAGSAGIVRGGVLARVEPASTPFERIYGALSLAPRMQGLAGRLPFDDAFQGAMADGLESLATTLRDAYKVLRDKGSWESRLTPVDRKMLTSLVDHAGADETRRELANARRELDEAQRGMRDAQLRERDAREREKDAQLRERKARQHERKAKERARAIRESRSFRMGRAVTSPLRAVRKLLGK